MIELYLMRHGIAQELGENGILSDADRPLSAAGIEKLKTAAEGLRELDPGFNLILTSPLLRCRQTAEIIAERLQMAQRVRVVGALAPGGAFASGEGQYAEIFLDLVAFQFKRALLVGHMPDLAEIASYLLAGNRNLNIEFRRGSICNIEVASLPPRGPGLLRWMMTQKQLRMIGKRVKR